MFYVTQSTLRSLSGRTKQSLYDYRRTKRFPFETAADGEFLYDVDNSAVARIINTRPRNAKADELKDLEEFQRCFAEARVKGDVVCEKTGEIDHMASLEENTIPDKYLNAEGEALLDTQKKVAEIKHKRLQSEKLEVALKALTGDLIERDTVESWVRRYLGNMHQQVLDMASTGIAGDLYSLVKREEDGNKAVKEIERVLEKALSTLLKDSTEIMRKNPL